MKITYRAGKLHTNADALGRRANTDNMKKGDETTQTVRVTAIKGKRSEVRNKSCTNLNQTCGTGLSLRDAIKHQQSDPK